MNKSGNTTTTKGKLLSSALKYVVPLAVSVCLCYLLFTGVDFGRMLDIIARECRFGWIALALVISVLSHVFRAMRWRIQLQALGIAVPLRALVLSIFGTYAVNLVFPRLGEVWRTGYIAQRQRASFTEVFGSMVAERLCDTLTVLVLTVAAFLLARAQLVAYLSQNSELYATVMSWVASPWLWCGVAAVVAVAWWFLSHRSANGVVLKVQDLARSLWHGFAVIATMPGKGRWLVLTVAIWGCYFTQLFVAFYAFDFTAAVVSDYGIVAVLVAFVLSSISMGVPSNGGIGPWQWAIIFALGIYGLESTSAGAFANLVLGTQTLLLIVLGIITFVAIAIEKRSAADNSK